LISSSTCNFANQPFKICQNLPLFTHFSSFFIKTHQKSNHFLTLFNRISHFLTAFRRFLSLFCHFLRFCALHFRANSAHFRNPLFERCEKFGELIG